MSVQEKCPKTGLRRVECSHCQGPLVGTWTNPRFSLDESDSSVRVLKNGFAWNRSGTHWGILRGEVNILVACSDVLQEFSESTDEQRHKFPFREILENGDDSAIHVSVEAHPDFVHSRGTTIPCPWLHLRGRNARIGLGADKCRAICALKEQLKDWLSRVAVQDKSRRHIVVTYDSGA
jgi:hypothetical protein